MTQSRILPGWAPDRTIACIAAAALALLQPGIDPVFLTLLTAATGLDPSDHGWIVGATQGGMAIGAVPTTTLNLDVDAGLPTSPTGFTTDPAPAAAAHAQR